MLLCCDEVIKIHSKCFRAWNLKAQAYFELNRFNLSLKCGEKLVEINNNDYRVGLSNLFII